MAHLIDKDVLLTKIEKRQSILDLDSPFGQGGMIELELVKDILNTLEVKETQYINKDILIAKIKKLMYDANLEADIASTGDCFDENIADAKYQLCKHILGIINTFEIKDIDLDKEIDSVEDRYHGFESLSRADVIDIAKYFFELGFKTQKGE